jgi:superfamily II DNA or RNA helicase
MATETEDLTQPQRDRLAFIELRVRFLGEVRRQDLFTRFSIQAAAASRDLATYKELMPGNIDYDSKSKVYVRAELFRPMFDFSPARVFSWLTQGYGDNEPTRHRPLIPIEAATEISNPDLETLSGARAGGAHRHDRAGRRQRPHRLLQDRRRQAAGADAVPHRRGQLSLAEAGRPWAFDAPGEEFKLAAEAYRINLAHLFDPMMAVHTSNVEPLPHQITAVYESMLPRQPLRYVLADDPGAGKTIMAGLFIRELLMRADAKRVLIVAPGSLVEQWQDEMFEKFGLTFTLFSREQVEQSRSGNPFDDIDLMVARVDQLSRNEDLQEKLRLSHWDLVVVDEAHKLSASYFGNKINKTKRFQLGELLGSITRHFLLMTATPHNGKEEDFQLFMSLLDADRFYGKFRDGAHKVDVTDLMRRMVKEDLLQVRRHAAVPRAPGLHRQLQAVRSRSRALRRRHRLREDRVEPRRPTGRRRAQGHGRLRADLAAAPAGLQPRGHLPVAQAPPQQAQAPRRGREAAPARQVAGRDARRQRHQRVPEDIWESADALSPEDYENFEEAVVDQATAAQTIQELEAEIIILEGLEEQARKVVHSGQDRKWDELSAAADTPEMHDADGRQRKLIIFTEHRDTLNYLAVKIRGLIGSEEAVVMIHGGVKREDRRKVQELFRNDPAARVLLATDAAGEGVNLQNANLMVNYDLPWNPNRLEQRFGRIHRIGQTEVCHLWNMVASETREGDVFQRLFEKLEVEREALGGRVFDILGEVFEDRSLKDLLIEAIRYGEDPRFAPACCARWKARWTPSTSKTSSSATPCAKR